MQKHMCCIAQGPIVSHLKNANVQRKFTAHVQEYSQMTTLDFINIIKVLETENIN